MAVGTLKALCAAMDDIALDTWGRFESGRLPGHRYDETSASDNNLAALRDRVPGLLIWQSSVSEEAKTGADWEWWIGDDEVGWLCVRMQAKRAYADDTYDQLRHGDAGNRQYDKLIRGCDPAEGRFPFHVFYNGWPEGTFHEGTHWAVPAHWNACPNRKEYDECGHVEPRHYGCAIAPSGEVKQISDAGGRSRYSIVEHLSKAVPWSYAFGFPQGKPGSEERWQAGIERRPPGGTWLDRIHGTLVVLTERGGASVARDITGHLKEIPGADRSTRIFDLPDYVRTMRGTVPGLFEPEAEEEVPAAPRTVILERKGKQR
ncbi:DUF6615 family protein [Kitasatospora sp. NPDC051853]|uniref:DUF6615 family protein n=1 Tax=Kitasatospora sp. NPDC051853 TaxID=3364058 RepID=UPI00379C0BAA